jgi:hypothetical protein
MLCATKSSRDGSLIGFSMEGIGELAGWTIRAARPAGRELDNAFVHRRDDELRRRVVGKPTGIAE